MAPGCVITNVPSKRLSRVPAGTPVVVGPGLPADGGAWTAGALLIELRPAVGVVGGVAVRAVRVAAAAVRPAGLLGMLAIGCRLPGGMVSRGPSCAVTCALLAGRAAVAGIRCWCGPGVLPAVTAVWVPAAERTTSQQTTAPMTPKRPNMARRFRGLPASAGVDVAACRAADRPRWVEGVAVNSADKELGRVATPWRAECRLTRCRPRPSAVARLSRQQRLPIPANPTIVRVERQIRRRRPTVRKSSPQPAKNAPAIAAAMAGNPAAASRLWRAL